MRGKRFAALKLLALPACLLGAGLAAAQDAPLPGPGTGLPATVFVLEAAKSMGDKVDGTAKLEIARKELQQTIADNASRATFGLIAFGHRKASDCADTEVLAKPGALDGETSEKLLGGLKPKGKSPTAAAIGEAASLANADQPLDVVLVTDGEDSCDADLCAAADALKQKSKGLRIHVVGLSGKMEDLQPLACIAAATGGKFAAATNQATFTQGLGAVLASIINPPVPLEPIAAAPPKAPMTAATRRLPGETAVFKSGTPAPDAPKRPVPVSFKALVTEGGAKLQSGLTWRVYNAKPTADGSFELISTHREPSPTTSLLPGEYLVNAAYGLSNLTKKVKVENGQSKEETFILNTGGLAMRAVLATGEECPEENVRFDILSDEADQFGKRETILADAKPRTIVRLNAGAYHIRSLYGDANAAVGVDVTVEPGKVTQATIKHTGAKITFRLVQTSGGEALANTKWTILTSAGDTVKSNAGALPTHILAAGSYAVVADHDGKSYTRRFNIEPGGDRQIEVAIADGPTSAEELKVLLDPPEGPAPGTGVAAGEGSGNAMGFDGFSARPADPNAPLINPGTLFRPSSP